MDTQDIIAVVSGLAAIITSAAAIRTAKASRDTTQQISQQTEETNRPQLVIREQLFTFVRQHPDKDYHEWSRRPKDDACPEPKKQQHKRTRFSVDLLNIGRGSAAKVSIRWSTDLDKAVALANRIARRKVCTMNEGWLITNSNSSAWMNQKDDYKDFVMPTQTGEEAVTVDVPHAYLQIVALLWHACIKNKDIITAKNAMCDTPDLRCHLMYRNISNNIGCTTITVQPIFISGSTDTIIGQLRTRRCQY